jgi:hypothetical protein
MTDLSYACRNFYNTDLDSNGNKNFIGYIDIYLKNSNTIEIQTQGLHENDYYIDYGQAEVIINFPENVDLYDLIITIFNKITEDHSYALRYITYNDHIICSDEFIEKYPDKCNHDRNENYTGGYWIPFTRENIQYLEFENTEVDNADNYIRIYGKVEYNENNKLEFTYDNPIVSKSMSKEYYHITRNRIVWDVKRDKNGNYYIIE